MGSRHDLSVDLDGLGGGLPDEAFGRVKSGVKGPVDRRVCASRNLVSRLLRIEGDRSPMWARRRLGVFWQGPRILCDAERVRNGRVVT